VMLLCTAAACSFLKVSTENALSFVSSRACLNAASSFSSSFDLWARILADWFAAVAFLLV